MKTYFKILFLSFTLFISQTSFAALSPVSVTLFPPLQFPSEDVDITGLRLSVIYGDHRNMNGLDLGLIANVTEQNFRGIAVSGLLNYTKENTTAIITQFAGLANVNVGKTTVIGLQIAAGLNYNSAESVIGGLQFALANMSPFTKIYGFEVGLYNKAQVINGIQIGLINVAESVHGIQIGLLNFNRTGLFSVSPIINVGF